MMIGASAFAQQVPNGSFENGWENCYPWEKGAKVSSAHGSQPKSWCTSNVPNSLAGDIGKEATGASGKGVQLNNVDALGNGIPAYMTLGTTWATAEANMAGKTRNTDGGVFGGISFAFRPDALSLKYKRDAMNDVSVVAVYAWKGTWTQADVPSNTAVGISYGNATKVTMTDRDQNILGLTTNTGGTVTNSADAQLIFYSKQEITDSPSSWTELVVPIGYVDTGSIPEKMNIVIGTAGYMNSGSITSGKSLYVDEVKFLYYSELSRFEYLGTNIPITGTTITVDEEYAESCHILFESNGQGATIEKSYDANTAIMTVTVKGEDIATNPSNYHTYTIQFKKPIIYRTITFVVDGAETPYTIAEGEATTKPADPTKEGYTFAGWSPAVSEKVSGDATYTATWNVNKHDIVYKVDGEVYKTVKDVEYGTELTAIDNPTKDGYTFSGWTGLPSTMPDNNVEVTGSFKICEYTITFEVNGEQTTQTVKYGEMPVKPADPVVEGYTFKKWVPEIVAATEEVTYSAYFDTNSYTLLYQIDGVDYSSSTVWYNDALSPIPNDEPKKDGYTFSGWNEEQPERMPAHDVTITGSWTPNKYTVAFVADDQTVSSEKLDCGSAISAPADPTKEGYTFTGWSPNVDETVPAHDVTYTAVFSVNQYKVTFMSEGSVVKEGMLDYGSTIEAPQNPTKEGFEFLRWDPEFVEGTTVPAQDVTYTAVFGKDAFVITYMVDGEVYTTSKVEFGTAVTAIAEPTKEGYTFSGWTGVPETMPAEAVTVTGSFTINKYEVKFVDEDGTVYSSESKEYGSALTAPANPTKDGYEFTGWTPDVAETVPAKDVTYTATWKEVVNAIAGISATRDAEYYTTNGVRLSAPRKGVNIVKFADGQIKKIFVK